MPRGKKYDAAEKHFLAEERHLNREIKARGEAYVELVKQFNAIKDDLLQVETENAQLHDWVDRLLEYTELSKEDIRQACEKDKEIAGVLKSIDWASGLIR